MAKMVKYKRYGKLSVFILMFSLVLAQTLTPAFASRESSGASEAEWESIKIVNKLRIANGQRPLSVMKSLSGVAETRAQEVSSYFSHYRPNGATFTSLLKENGLSYGRAGENIAYGQQAPADVVAAWMDSDSHRENMLGDSYYHIGMGYVVGGAFSPAWSQNLLVDGCSITAVSIADIGSYCAIGDDIDSLNGRVEVTCSKHGLCHLPLIQEMCPDFDSASPGKKTIRVTYENQTAEFEVSVIDSIQINDPSPPAASPSDVGGIVAFSDINEGDFFYEDINYVATLGIMKGISAVEFDPYGSVSRAMITEILYRMAGEPTVRGVSGFSDISETDWFYASAVWAERNGIINGVGANRFDPKGLVTREQLAALLYRYSGEFQDISDLSGSVLDRQAISEWSALPVAWALESGIMELDGSSAFNPKGEVRRYECAIILSSLLRSQLSAD